MKEVKEKGKWYYEKYQKEFKIYDDDRRIFEDLPLSNEWRPKWDIKVLQDIGFTYITPNLDVGKELYSDWEQELYSITPLFEILATKI